MKYIKPLFAPFLMAAFLLFMPANGIAADSDLDLSDEEINELERLEDLVRGGGSTPAPTQDDTADKVSEEKARAEAARLADEKRKKDEVARLADEKRKKDEVARLADEKRKKAEVARLADEKRKKAEVARKASEEATTKAADAAVASSAAMLKVLDAKIRILKIKQDAMERKLNKTGANAESDNTRISGFVDMSYFSDTNADTASFGMDQVEVDITHTVDKASLRFDLEYGDTGVAVEQGYITINVGTVTLTFGKFNAPIGFELLDAPDMYQYSHAMVFDYGIPGNLTGAMVSGGSGIIDYAVYVVNGWDNNTDDNTDKHFGGRLGITPMEGINIGFSYISGNELEVDDDPDMAGDQDDADQTLVGDNYNRSVIDIDFTYTRQENLTIGAEYNIGTEEKSSLVDTGAGEWIAYLVMVHYDFSDKFGLTARYDSFDDQDGSRLGSKEIRNAITIAPTFAIAEGLGGLIEWKTTTSDEKVFEDKDGNPKDSEQTLALELTFGF